MKRGHPHAPADYYEGADTHLVIQNCGDGLKTFTQTKNGEYVLDRPYRRVPNEQMTLIYSVAKSAHENGWRENRALVIYQLPDKDLSVSLMRSVVDPTLDPQGQIHEVFGNGTLSHSPTCRALPMAARQLDAPRR